jgi:hypothetical protein
MICYSVGLAVRIFPATTRTLTKDTALSEQGRGATWHVWINAQHGMCELTHSMAGKRHGHGMLCVNRPLMCAMNKCHVWCHSVDIHSNLAIRSPNTMHSQLTLELPSGTVTDPPDTLWCFFLSCLKMSLTHCLNFKYLLSQPQLEGSKPPPKALKEMYKVLQWD